MDGLVDPQERIGQRCSAEVAIIRLLAGEVGPLFWSRPKLHHEILIPRHQLNILRRVAPRRVALNNFDRWLFVSAYRLWPDVLKVELILRPEAIVRWHRQGFRAYWRSRSRGLLGRPRAPKEARDLVREISLADPL